MRTKLLVALVVALAVGFFAGIAQADKFLCITSPGEGGNITVAQCLAKGERFAIVDENGVPRELNDTEINILKKTNPKILGMKAFGIDKAKDAPALNVPWHGN